MQNRGILVEKKDGVDPWTHEPKAGDYVTDLKLTDVGKTRALQPDEVLIKVKAVGICGSDVHYWTAGRGARFAVKDKMVLGHEGAGEIVEVGEKVANVVVGDRVAFEPGYATGEDELTKNGRYNLSKVFFCATPPDDGCLCQFFVHKASCCYVMPEGMSYEVGAMIEPLSVGIHAAKRARVEPGQKVLITGAGPIGLVSAIAAKARGAGEVVLTDVIDSRLELARSLGFETVNVMNKTREQILEELGQKFDAVMECTGRTECMQLGKGSSQYSIFAAKPGSTVVLVGLAPRDKMYELPIMLASVQEIDIRGVFRYCNTWPAGITIAQKYEKEIKALISHRFNLEQFQEAFDLALSGKCMKVMFTLE